MSDTRLLKKWRRRDWMSRRTRSLGHPLPLQARDELPGQGHEVAEHVRECLAWRLLHRQHLDRLIARRSGGRGGTRWRSPRRSSRGACRRPATKPAATAVVVVHQSAEEPEGLGLAQTRRRPHVGELHLEALALWCSVPMARSSSALEQCARAVGRQPVPECFARRAPRAADGRAGSNGCRRLVQQDEEVIDAKQSVAALVQVVGATLERLVRDWRAGTAAPRMDRRSA